MADFTEAFARTARHEGGYVDDPLDRGGETYRGIARTRHPDWPGWALIDAARAGADFPRCLAHDQRLQAAVAGFYREHFWIPIDGDSLPDQALANELFDTAVNMGVGRSVRFLQAALNLLNRNGRDYPDLAQDGRLGPVTRQALEDLLANPDERTPLLKLLNIQQGARYVALMNDDPTQERFARGWLKRV